MSQLTQLFTTWPGDLVYHLVVLFAIEVMVGLAISGRRRSQDTRSLRRVLWVGLALSGGQVVLIGAVLVTRVSGIPSITVAPLLERWLSAAGLGLLAWAFVPRWQNSRRAVYALVVANPLVALLTWAFLAPNWYRLASQGETVNGTPADVAWGVWGAGLAALALAGLWSGRPGGRGDQSEEWDGGWGQSLAAFGLIFAAHLAHTFFTEPGFLAGWPRLATFIAYPLLAVSVYQHVIDRPSSAYLARPGAGGDPWPLFEALQQVALSSDPGEALRQAAAAMPASLPGLGLVAVGVPGEQAETVELPAVRRPAAAVARGETFRLDAQPAIKHAITHKQGLPLDYPSEPAAELAGCLGLESPIPLWVEPMVHARQALGVLIVGQAQAEPGWPPQLVRSIQVHAARLGDAVYAAHALQAARLHQAELGQQLAQLEKSSASSQAEAGAALEAVQVQLQQAKAELEAARRQSAQYSKRVDDLVALVQLQNEVAAQAQAGKAAQEK
ncbi:MAG: hypothetical protein JW850_07615 [Thermoflexales bacterium]|nr:hypothetical protein [Thermoflexales bacterium]